MATIAVGCYLPKKEVLVVGNKKQNNTVTIFNYSDSIFPNDTILKIQNLKFLYIFSRDFKPLHHIKFDTTKLKTLNHLKTLTFLGYDLKDFPMELSMLDSLENLNIVSCNITDYPKDLSDFKNLKSLSLSLNQIKLLPKDVISNNLLQKLYLSNNQIVSVDTGFLHSLQLKELYLGNSEDTEGKNFALNKLTLESKIQIAKYIKNNSHVNKLLLGNLTCEEKDLIKKIISDKKKLKILNIRNEFKCKTDKIKTSLTLKNLEE